MAGSYLRLHLPPRSRCVPRRPKPRQVIARSRILHSSASHSCSPADCYSCLLLLFLRRNPIFCEVNFLLNSSRYSYSCMSDFWSVPLVCWVSLCSRDTYTRILIHRVIHDRARVIEGFTMRLFVYLATPISEGHNTAWRVSGAMTHPIIVVSGKHGSQKRGVSVLKHF